MSTIQRVLAIPAKCFDRASVAFLTKTEVEAILEAPDNNSWSGQRDRVMLTVLYNTGARISELIAVRRKDIDGKPARAVLLHGKGRKERVLPLWRRTNDLLSDWLARLQAVPNAISTATGSRFTSTDFAQVLKGHYVRISMDGKGQALENIFVDGCGAA